MKKYKKFFFLLVFLLLPIQVFASFMGFDVPSANDYATQIETRYHLNATSIQGLGESLNTNTQKVTAPGVSLVFSPANPVPGKEVTANANSLNFGTGSDKLYYTWFLKHKDCEIGSSATTFCDLNDDGKVDENDWKIEAMRTLANGGFDSSRADYSIDKDNDGYTAEFGGEGSQSTKRCYAQDPTSGVLFELSECTHFFPKPSSGISEVGKGTFGRGEEEFWQTDPQNPDTAGTGRGDGANVSGLGQNSLTWTYMVGDQVGVVVEGTSVVPTKYTDNSFAIMWALPKKNCAQYDAVLSPIKDDGSCGVDENKVPIKGVYIKGYCVKIPIGTLDIDTCIKDNLVDPREGGQTEKLKASLVYGPETLSNDSSGDAFGDTVIVSGTTDSGTTNEQSLNYDWSVYMSKSGSFDPRGYSPDPKRDTTANGGWIDMTTFLKTNNLITYAKGNGVKDLKITLNITDALLAGYANSKVADANKSTISKLKVKDLFSDGTGYFKVSSRVTEYIEVDQKTRSDTASVIIPVVSTSRYVSTTQVKVVNNKLETGPVICNEKLNTDPKSPDYNPIGIGKNLCLVAKDEIIGLHLDADPKEPLKDYQWTLDGEPMNCSSAISSACSDASGTDTNFFPITGEVGETHEVSLSATNVEKGKKLVFSRVFEIVEPYITITSTTSDTAWPKYLGYYKGTDGYAYENLSSTQFQGFPDGKANFKVNFFPSWLEGRSDWSWTINGNALSGSKIKNVDLNLIGSPGTIYTLRIEGIEKEDDVIRKALADFWDVSNFESAEHDLSATVDVQVVSSEEEESALTSPKSFFAAVVKNAPQQILFIVQLFLSVFVIVVLMSFIFSLGRKE